MKKIKIKKEVDSCATVFLLVDRPGCSGPESFLIGANSTTDQSTAGTLAHRPEWFTGDFFAVTGW